MDLAVAALVFATVLFLGLAGSSLWRPRPVRQRLVRLADGSAARLPDGSRASSPLPRKHSGSGWIYRALKSVGGSTSSRQPGTTGPLRGRLIHAGYRRESAVSVYMGIRIVLAITLPVVILLNPMAWSLAEWRLVPMLCGATAVGYLIPSWVLHRRVRSRQRKIELALPDALDLMVVCVEAGLGINASLARVAREFVESNPILSAEFDLVSLEIRAGKSTVEALRALAVRTGVSEIRSLVALLVQTERFGTSVADALRVHADAMRVRRMQRAEEAAGKAPLKMIFPTVVIFAATLIVLLAPAVFRFNGVFER